MSDPHTLGCMFLHRPSTSIYSGIERVHFMLLYFTVHQRQAPSKSKPILGDDFRTFANRPTVQSKLRSLVGVTTIDYLRLVVVYRSCHTQQQQQYQTRHGSQAEQPEPTFHFAPVRKVITVNYWSNHGPVDTICKTRLIELV